MSTAESTTKKTASDLVWHSMPCKKADGYRPVVAREAVGDRNPDAHEANLYDIDAKYGDVVSVNGILEYLGKIPIVLPLRFSVRGSNTPSSETEKPKLTHLKYFTCCSLARDY
jgi:hypothetical protein